MKLRLTTACAAVAVTLMVSCGGDDDSGPADGDSTSVDALVAVMVDQGAPQDEAACVAEKLDGVTATQLFEFFEAVAAGEEVVATEGVAKQVLNARGACEAGA